MRSQFFRPFCHAEPSIRPPRQYRRVQPPRFSFPPISDEPLFFDRCEPVLPQHRPYKFQLGFPRNNASTSSSFSSSLSSVNGTKLFCLQPPSDAIQRFHSKRG